VENLYINPMREFSEIGIKTRISGPQLLDRHYSYRQEKAFQFFGTLNYNI